MIDIFYTRIMVQPCSLYPFAAFVVFMFSGSTINRGKISFAAISVTSAAVVECGEGKLRLVSSLVRRLDIE